MIQTGTLYLCFYLLIILHFYITLQLYKNKILSSQKIIKFFFSNLKLKMNFIYVLILFYFLLLIFILSPVTILTLKILFLILFNIIFILNCFFLFFIVFFYYIFIFLLIEFCLKLSFNEFKFLFFFILLFLFFTKFEFKYSKVYCQEISNFFRMYKHLGILKYLLANQNELGNSCFIITKFTTKNIAYIPCGLLTNLKISIPNINKSIYNPDGFLYNLESQKIDKFFQFKNYTGLNSDSDLNKFILKLRIPSIFETVVIDTSKCANFNVNFNSSVSKRAFVSGVKDDINIYDCKLLIHNSESLFTDENYDAVSEKLIFNNILVERVVTTKNIKAASEIITTEAALQNKELYNSLSDKALKNDIKGLKINISGKSNLDPLIVDYSKFILNSRKKIKELPAQLILDSFKVKDS